MVFAAAGFFRDSRTCARSARRSNQTGRSTAAVRAISAAQSSRSAVPAARHRRRGSRLARGRRVRSWQQANVRPTPAPATASTPADQLHSRPPHGQGPGVLSSAAMSSGLWVTRTTVRSLRPCRSSASIARPDSASRWAVGFIQQDHVRAGQERAGDGEALALASAEEGSAGSDPGIQAVLEPPDQRHRGPRRQGVLQPRLCISPALASPEAPAAGCRGWSNRRGAPPAGTRQHARPAGSGRRLPGGSPGRRRAGSIFRSPRSR